MTDQFPPPPPPSQDPAGTPPPPPPGGYGAPPPLPTAPPPPTEGGYLPPIQYGAPIGKVRATGTCILLALVTCGIYTLVWYFQTHEEMKKHTGDGLGGAIALILALFVGVASPFLSSAEVGKMQERAGRPVTVSAVTGLWYIPGIFILVGPIVWFVKTNGALNDYWRSLGAEG